MEMKKQGVGKYTRLGIWLNFTLMTLAAVGVLVLINMIARTPGFWWRYDLTDHELNELSPQTIKIVENLPEQVEVFTFLRPDRPYTAVIEELDVRIWRMLKQYRYYSKNKIVHTQYRLDQEYGAAKSKLQELQIKDDNNLIVVRSGEGKEARVRVLRLIPDFAIVAPPQKTFGNERAARLDFFRGEEALNGAILAVTETKKPRIGFVAKHGEFSIFEETDNKGLYQFADSLRKYGYEIADVDLHQNAAYLKELAVIVIIGPQTGISDEELNSLRTYLDQGGRLLLALHPVLEPNPQREQNFAKLLGDWGLKARVGVVCEPVGGQYGLVECVSLQILDGLSPLHPITRDLRKLQIRLRVPNSRAFESNGSVVEGVTLVDLAATGLRAWEDLPGGKQLFPDPGTESIGRRVVAAAVEKEIKDQKKRARVVLLGTPFVAVNAFIGETQDFMVNSVSWLADRENLISVAPKMPEQRFMTWTDGKDKLFFWGCLFVVPAMSLLCGFFVWFFRRR